MARRASAAGLAAIALTDHDTTAGVAAAAEAGAALGLRVVPGCELSVRAPWGELHVLGYFVEPGDPKLEAFLETTRAARRRRGEQMVTRLQALGVPIALEDVARAAAGGAVGRPHVARALVERGFVSNSEEAFARFIGYGRPAFVEKDLPEFDKVVNRIHEAGGLAAAAHLQHHGTLAFVESLARSGLDALEVRHPSHSPRTERRLTWIATTLGLGVSGGSDWHGGKVRSRIHALLGTLAIPEQWLVDLEDRCRSRSRIES